MNEHISKIFFMIDNKKTFAAVSDQQEAGDHSSPPHFGHTVSWCPIGLDFISPESGLEIRINQLYIVKAIAAHWICMLQMPFQIFLASPSPPE